MKRQLARVFGLLFFLQIIAPAALAEQLSLEAFDIESPVINFEKGDSKILDGKKIFTAEVTDNVGIAVVILYYKNATDSAFTPKQMMRLNDSLNIYSVELLLNPDTIKELEVFIKAEDVSGNSVFEGQKFSPLTYTVISDEVIEEATIVEDEVIEIVKEENADSLPDLGTQAELAKVEEDEGGTSWWVWALGAVAIGALAGGDSGGGSSNGGDPEGEITITW